MQSACLAVRLYWHFMLVVILTPHISARYRDSKTFSKMTPLPLLWLFLYLIISYTGAKQLPNINTHV